MMSVEMSVKRGFRGRRRKVQAQPRDAHEEHFVLRVRDEELVERIQSALSQEVKSEESETEDSSKDITHVEHEPLDIKSLPYPPTTRWPDVDGRLVFEDPKRGKLYVNEESFPVGIARLPTAVESFKTLDDVHCVKLSRVKQILIVGEEEGEETEDGITPPFENARDRYFKPEPSFSKEEVSQVEDALLSIFEGWAPAGWKFIDREEQCVPEGGKLVWKQV